MMRLSSVQAVVHAALVFGVQSGPSPCSNVHNKAVPTHEATDCRNDGLQIIEAFHDPCKGLDRLQVSQICPAQHRCPLVNRAIQVAFNSGTSAMQQPARQQAWRNDAVQLGSHKSKLIWRRQEAHVLVPVRTCDQTAMRPDKRHDH